jgi:hypothetical protein
MAERSMYNRKFVQVGIVLSDHQIQLTELAQLDMRQIRSEVKP